MFYVFSKLPTATKTEDEAYTVNMPLTAGIIHQVDVLFQDGCAHETFVQIWHRNFQIWPSNRGEQFRGNATAISFREFYELQPGNTTLTAKVWTSLSSTWYEIIIQIGLLPKRIIQPMSFDELLAAAAGLE